MRYKYYIPKNVYDNILKDTKKRNYQKELNKILLADCELPRTGLLYKNLWRTEHSSWSAAPRTFWLLLTKADVKLYVLREIIFHNDEPSTWTPDGNDKIVKELYDELKLNEEELDEIDAIFNELLIPKIESKSHKTIELSQAEDAFILDNSNEINFKLFEETIYETKEWIKKIQKKGFNDYDNVAITIKDYIYNNLFSEDGWKITEVKDFILLLYHKGQDWILVNMIDKDAQIDLNDLQQSNPPLDYYRGYPYSYIYDPDNWRKMELDEKSNMVLSENQVDIVSSKIKYPVFLTGRAGSGKSTLLQYLFAEIIIKYIKSSKECAGDIKEPVYLSYSENLIESAKDLCQTLFSTNDVYLKSLQSVNIDYKKDIEPIMSNMFFVFDEIVRNCIDNKESGISSKKFPKGVKHISFPSFNSKWNLRIKGKSSYGPSTSWYVIRTYIKGWDIKGYLTPEEYREIGEKNKDKAISYEIYKEIYENDWLNWYADFESKGFWDDQDLIRYCLNNKCVDDSFSAIFCDESQDFTRIEMEFILKLSSFSYRKIPNISYINKLPFVFAGDESQTLNPTGFSWDLLRGFFTNKLCEYIGYEKNVNEVLIPETIELSENFRSTSQIVRLSNRIQLLRASRFGLKKLEPQKPYFSQKGDDIYCLSPSDAASFEELKKKQVTLIIPTEEDESIKSFIENSSLRDKIVFDTEDESDITILNPIQAKGLEYPNVAIFGFNSKSKDFNVDNLLKWYKQAKADKSESVYDIQLKYTLSNAYVAVTRAQSNLYIIDDFKDDSFWAFAFNQEENQVLEKKIRDLEDEMMINLSKSQLSKWSKKDLGWIVYDEEGIDISDENLEYLRSEKHKDDLEKRAEERNDSSMMRKAARRHKGENNYIDEARCRAKAFRIDEEYIKAAESFEKANMYTDAVNCYWLELNTNKNINIISKIASLKNYVHNLKQKICEKCYNSTVKDLNIFFDDTIEFIKKNEEEQSNNEAWQFVLNLILKNAKIKNLTDKKFLEYAYDKVRSLIDFNIILDKNAFAELAFKAESYNLAVTIWEEQDKLIRPANYYYAKLKIVKYPESLEYYEGTKYNNWQSLLLEDFNKHRKIELDDKHKEYVSSAILSVSKNKKDYEAFMPFMLKKANYNESNVILSKAKTIETNINYTLLYGLVETRFTNLSEWEKSEDIFIDTEASTLQNAINEIKLMREDGFKDKIKQDLEPLKGGQKRSVFNRNYGKYSRTSASKLLFTEFGKVMESTGFFLNAIVFYEWAQDNTDDPEIKLLMKKRWIACKERQANNDDSSDYWQDAQKERDLHNIHEELPLEPILSEEDWEKMFKHYMVISSEVRKRRPRIFDVEPNTERKENPVIEESQDNSGTEIEQKEPLSEKKLPNNKYEFNHKNYSIVYFPSKGDIVLKNVEEEFSVRIKNGKFPGEADFYIKDGRIYQTEDDMMTPFVIEESDNYVTLKVFDGNDSTGLFIGAEKIKNN